MSKKKTEQLSFLPFEEMSLTGKAIHVTTEKPSNSSVISIHRTLDKRKKESDAKTYNSILGRIDHLLK